MALWHETPLVYSVAISKIVGCAVYLKLENVHISHSFKYRGISLFAQKAVEKHGPNVHLIIASGGNAGLAAACAAHALGVKCSVYIPEGVADRTLAFLSECGAQVIVGGQHYAQALKAAGAAVKDDELAVMVPAYDDPVVWEGHGSMIPEISQQLRRKPDAIFCSVGGGGLLGGIITGCKSIGWDNVPLVALETIGSNCFHHTMSLNRGKPLELPQNVDVIQDPVYNVQLARFHGFTSRASGSLGATQPDELSMQAACFFAGLVVFSPSYVFGYICSTFLQSPYI